MYHLLKKHCHVPRDIKFARIFLVSAAPLANVVVHHLMFVVMDGVVLTAILMHLATLIHAMTAPNNYNAAGVLPLEHVSQQ